MIPIRDDNPTRTTPFVTFLLIGVNVAVFLHELSLGPALEGFLRQWGLTPAILTDRRAFPDSLVTLVSSAFLHGGFLHLGANMLYLWIFGDNVEDRLGHVSYLFFYVAGGIAAGLTHVFIFPGSPTPLVGASGAVAAVTGAYLVFFPRARVLTVVPIFIFLHFVRLPAVALLLLWFVVQFIYGTMSVGIAEPGALGAVAWWAHVGGFLFGMAMGPSILAFKAR